MFICSKFSSFTHSTTDLDCITASCLQKTCVHSYVTVKEKDLQRSEQELDSRLQEELQMMKSELTEELANIRQAVYKVSAKRSKEDQVSKLIEAFMASLDH